MMLVRRPAAALLAVLALGLSLVTLRAQQTATATGTKTWIGRAAEMEAYLKSAEVDHMEGTAVGVTKPRHVFLKPGGPFTEMNWKVLPPGMYNGYHESYKTEVAGYEMDKLLELNMVPPTVERTVAGQTGAAVMWINGTKSFKELGGVPTPPGRFMGLWNRELVFAKMFDDLIGNSDPNLGNWLVDSEWNIILIDHSRAFTDTKELYHQLIFFDPDLWAKMKALDEASLTTAIGNWVDKNGIKAMLQRRDKMEQVINKLKAAGQD